MAEIFYGLNREYAADLSKQPTRNSGSTTGLDIQIVIDDASGITSKEVYMAMKRFAEYIKDQPFSGGVNRETDL